MCRAEQRNSVCRTGATRTCKTRKKRGKLVSAITGDVLDAGFSCRKLWCTFEVALALRWKALVQPDHRVHSWPRVHLPSAVSAKSSILQKPSSAWLSIRFATCCSQRVCMRRSCAPRQVRAEVACRPLQRPSGARCRSRAAPCRSSSLRLRCSGSRATAATQLPTDVTEFGCEANLGLCRLQPQPVAAWRLHTPRIYPDHAGGS